MKPCIGTHAPHLIFAQSSMMRQQCTHVLHDQQTLKAHQHHVHTHSHSGPLCMSSIHLHTNMLLL